MTHRLSNLMSETEILLLSQVRMLEEKIRLFEASKERAQRRSGSRNQSSGVTPTLRGRNRHSLERKVFTRKSESSKHASQSTRKKSTKRQESTSTQGIRRHGTTSP